MRPKADICRLRSLRRSKQCNQQPKLALLISIPQGEPRTESRWTSGLALIPRGNTMHHARSRFESIRFCGQLLREYSLGFSRHLNITFALVVAAGLGACALPSTKESPPEKSLSQAISLAAKPPGLAAVATYLEQSHSARNSLVIRLVDASVVAKVQSDTYLNGEMKVVHVFIDRDACIGYSGLVQKAGAIRPRAVTGHGDQGFRYLYYDEVVVRFMAWPDRWDCTQSVSFRYVPN